MPHLRVRVWFVCNFDGVVVNNEKSYKFGFMEMNIWVISVFESPQIFLNLHDSSTGVANGWILYQKQMSVSLKRPSKIKPNPIHQ